ncbi:unnamed protein product [Soboliphyme baturini]|uniref:non-specific serine/threonine protein kinase n=1 Tax=Soboliphyme baturini TaxID=241478 RepID=A0A183IHX4_9BILA|nr:unnamed protein product [Soboliphyme baturini]
MVIKERWEVLDAIGKGSFGKIFRGYDIQMGWPVAIKTEKVDCSLPQLEPETYILRALQGGQHIAKFLGCGNIGNVNFLVMQHLGQSLHTLRYFMPRRRFTRSTTLRLGIQMLEAVQMMHDHGFLHRDIKPANFVLGSAEDRLHRLVYIIDFGLSRAYADLTSSRLRRPRQYCRFKGTIRYASVGSLHFEDTSRRDDLWSLFYVMLEMLVARLPWHSENQIIKIVAMKKTTDYEYLLGENQPEMLHFLNHLQSLNYYARPDYDMLYSIFTDGLRADNVHKDDPFDWEIYHN